MRAWALLLALMASTAHAQDDELAAGRAARASGDHAAALAQFSAAWSSSGAPVARAEMALEELVLERFVLAETHATEALTFASDPGVAALREQLELTQRTAASHLGNLDVRATAGAEVRVDGELVGSAPLPRLVRVPRGSHTIVATLDDHEPAEQQVDVTDETVVRVELAPVAIDRRPILERMGGTGDGERIVGFTALGVGGALLIAGAVTLGLSIDRDQQLRSPACAPSSPMETREAHCPSLASERASFGDAGRITLAIGGVLAAIGIVLVVTAPSPPNEPAPSVACVPAFELGAACTIRF